VTDAAVLFLLTLRSKGVRTPDDIQPCTVLWDDEAAQEYEEICRVKPILTTV
jgi:hypothetical protein